ncbi:helix-turn-helix domain-containing protein [Pseudomonas sp. BIC9C]|uniref:winged helix-turn-helix domain-containing protein n=1 Tax=Pseudomonas sp. BIC9C TaxID=3078458 RepID=UPI002AD27FAE|nr:helix-turn-helix domain-containing protein [Pseudomonas sp. BIC9C]
MIVDKKTSTLAFGTPSPVGINNSLESLIAKLQSWTFNKPECLLISDKTTINLTPTECIVLDLLASGSERVVSNEEILARLNKDPGNYKGLRMCLSRLQAKFKKVTKGDNLFRPVRNRGYCLIQVIHPD